MPDDIATIIEPQAKIGHNSGDPGPLINIEDLRDELAMRFRARAERVAELTAGIARWREQSAGGIVDDDFAGRTTDFLSQIKREADAIETARKDMKAPVLQAGKIIDAFFEDTLALDLKNGMAAMREALRDFLDRKAEAEAARRAAEAKRQAEESARALAEAEKTGDEAQRMHGLAAEERAIEEARASQAPRAGMDVAKAAGDLGGKAGLRGTWKWRVTDAKKVPKKYLVISDALVNAEMRANTRNGECSASIPGIEFYLEKTVAVR